MNSRYLVLESDIFRITVR